ncbi:penicillin-binding protein 2 [Halonatronum saccharophilum]|uniref:penicillin-binding protein 2 n=1 Tax=Halonatronum saccharophilum TaxID=150060 RepID=UPI0004AE889C|nr:penicillin-binding protein 2 [Halonatronum saccharophilum]
MNRSNNNSDRLFSLFIVIVLSFFILAARLYYLQIYKGNIFKDLSEGNRTTVRVIEAPRGRIYDRNERVLVSNKLVYSVAVIPSKVNDLDNISSILSEILEISYEEILNKLSEADSRDTVLIKRDISQKELIMLEEIKREMPALIIDQIPTRDYINDNFASHLLGYIGEISRAELIRFTDSNYRIGNLIGKTGLELTYESYLRGKEGRSLIEIDNRGQKIRTLGVESPTPGYDLILNLDYDLQASAESLLKGQIESLIEEAKKDEEITLLPTGGSVIVSDPNDGSILAMANYPDYNPNLFVNGISSDDWLALSNNPRRPLMNRAISTSAPPASVFKIVTGVAGIEELGIEGNTEFYDPGYYQTGGVRFGNWYTGGQGNIDFIDSMAWSNNTVYYKIGHQLYNKDRNLLQSYAREFGLGSKTGIDLHNESSGLVPDPEWRMNHFQRREDTIWYPGYTINLSIGQDNLRTSPIQLANIVNSIANGGKLYQPLLVDKIINSDGEIVKDLKPELLNELPVSKNSIDIMREALESVTQYGTARNVFADMPISVAGKTGTAQTGSNRPNHGWFAGFMPAEDPEISVVVFIEYGISSGNTLPIAKGVIREYFDLKEDIENRDGFEVELEDEFEVNLSDDI